MADGCYFLFFALWQSSLCFPSLVRDAKLYQNPQAQTTSTLTLHNSITLLKHQFAVRVRNSWHCVFIVNTFITPRVSQTVMVQLFLLR